MTPFHSTSKSDFCVWKIPCVLKIFSKPRLVKNSRATGVKMRPEMVKEMQIEILNGKEILVNCKFKFKNNLKFKFKNNLRFAFLAPFRVSSSREQAVGPTIPSPGRGKTLFVKKIDLAPGVWRDFRYSKE